MLTADIENIIVKYLNKEASVSELHTLDQWLKEDGQVDVFKNYVKTNHLINSNTIKFNTPSAKKKLLATISEEQKVIRMRSFYRIARYAALFMILLAIGFLMKENLFLRNDSNIENPTKVVQSPTKIGTDKAKLTLEDGSEVILNRGQSYQTSYAESNGEGIVYKNEVDESVDLVHNVLTIPRGGQFFIQLADGTKVWLNSESQLKYPVAFTEGETRKVELIYGEAYFEVSPSTAHQGDAFRVKSSQQSVVVLGTQFNIKAYRDETKTYTTLVEGKVRIDKDNKKEVLKPGQQSVVSDDASINVQEVDVNIETAWKEGLFSFKNKSLKDIMLVLSRWYDVDIIFENKDLEQIRFKGVLSKNQHLEDILSTIENLKVINGFDVDDKKILIK